MKRNTAQNPDPVKGFLDAVAANRLRIGRLSVQELHKRLLKNLTAEKVNLREAREIIYQLVTTMDCDHLCDRFFRYGLQQDIEIKASWMAVSLLIRLANLKYDKRLNMPNQENAQAIKDAVTSPAEKFILNRLLPCLCAIRQRAGRTQSIYQLPVIYELIDWLNCQTNLSGFNPNQQTQVFNFLDLLIIQVKHQKSAGEKADWIDKLINPIINIYLLDGRNLYIALVTMRVTSAVSAILGWMSNQYKAAMVGQSVPRIRENFQRVIDQITMVFDDRENTAGLKAAIVHQQNEGDLTIEQTRQIMLLISVLDSLLADAVTPPN